MVRDVLMNLGLGPKEIAIYYSLVKLGASPAAAVAKDVNLPRQTVYSLLEHLVSEEMVDMTERRGVKQFFVDPNKLFFLMERQKRRLERNQRLLEEDINELLALQKKGKGTFPHIQYYEGIKGLKRLFGTMLDQFRAKKDTLFRGYGVNQYPPELDSFLRDFIRDRGELGVETQLFISEGSDNFDSPQYGRKIKRLNIPNQEAGL